MISESKSYDEILTAAEIAHELRCSTAQVHRLIRGEVKNTPRIPALSLGRKKIVRRSKLEEWKKENELRSGSPNGK